jgi:hypothetical protein
MGQVTIHVLPKALAEIARVDAVPAKPSQQQLLLMQL